MNYRDVGLGLGVGLWCRVRAKVTGVGDGPTGVMVMGKASVVFFRTAPGRVPVRPSFFAFFLRFFFDF